MSPLRREVLTPADLEEALNDEIHKEAYQLDTYELQKPKEAKAKSHQSGIDHAGQMKAKFEGVSAQQKKHWEKYETSLIGYASFATEVSQKLARHPSPLVSAFRVAFREDSTTQSPTT